MSERTVGKHLRDELGIPYQRAVQLVRQFQDPIRELSQREKIPFKDAAAKYLRAEFAVDRTGAKE